MTEVAQRKIGTMAFVTAEILADTKTGTTIRYSTGFNMSGTNDHEVLQAIRHPDGKVHRCVIMRGLSSAKAAAITMILNAPED